MKLTSSHFAPSWELNVLLRCLLVHLRFLVFLNSLEIHGGFLQTCRKWFVAGCRPELETRTRRVLTFWDSDLHWRKEMANSSWQIICSWQLRATKISYNDLVATALNSVVPIFISLRAVVGTANRKRRLLHTEPGRRERLTPPSRILILRLTDRRTIFGFSNLACYAITVAYSFFLFRRCKASYPSEQFPFTLYPGLGLAAACWRV